MNPIVIKSSELKKKDVNAVLQGIFLKCGKGEYPVLAQRRTAENYGRRVDEINETTISLMASVLKNAADYVAEAFLKPLFQKLNREQILELAKGTAGRELIKSLPKEQLSNEIVESIEKNILASIDENVNSTHRFRSTDDSFRWLINYYGDEAYERYKNVKAAAAVFLSETNCPVEIISKYKNEPVLQDLIVRTEYESDTDDIKLEILNSNPTLFAYTYSQNYGKLLDKFSINYSKREKEVTSNE